MIQKLAASSLAFLLFSLPSQAIEVEIKNPLKQYTEWVELLGQEYWRPMQLKLQQINDTYVHKYTKEYFEFKAPHGDCKNEVKEGKLSQVFRENFKLTSMGNNHRAQIDYIDCKGRIAFTEVVRVQGPGAKQLQAKQLVNGERHFALRKGETFREQVITLQDNTQLVKTVSYVTPYGISTQILVDGKVHHDLKYNKYSKVNTYDIFDWGVRFNYRGLKFNSKVSGFKRKLSLDTRFHQFRYFEQHNGEMHEVTPIRLKEIINQWGVASIGFAIKQFLEAYIENYFPVSQFNGGGSSSDKLIQQLEEAFEFASSGEKDRLLLIIDELLQATKKGEIVDRRPQ